MSNYLPPKSMKEKTVVPGPVLGDACPPPSEIVVIEANKVFDFCFQEDVLERCFFVPDLPNGAAVTECEITEVTCEEVNDREAIPDHPGLFAVAIHITLTMRVTILPAPNANPVVVTRQIAFPKRVVLCAPAGTEVRCDVQGACICTVQPQADPPVAQEPNICCTIQLRVVSSTEQTAA